VALFDRRKGYGEYTLDRRRSYVDVVERVLGSDFLSRRPRQRNCFARELQIAGAAAGTAVSSVEVRILDSIDDES
jgi:hypothetical protein